MTLNRQSLDVLHDALVMSAQLADKQQVLVQISFSRYFGPEVTIITRAKAECYSDYLYSEFNECHEYRPLNEAIGRLEELINECSASSNSDRATGE